MLIQRPARCLFYVCVKCKPSFQSENGVNSHELVYFNEKNFRNKCRILKADFSRLESFVYKNHKLKPNYRDSTYYRTKMSQRDSEAALSEGLLANARNGSQVQAPEQGCKQPVAINDWSWCGTRVPKNQVTYITQVVLVYGIIAVSLSQLILQSADKELWLILLSTSVGYVLPAPRLKFLKPKISLTSTATTTATTSASSSLSFPLPTTNALESREIVDDSSSSIGTEISKNQPV